MGAAVPIGMAAASAVYGHFAGKSARNAAMQRSPEEQGYLKAQTGLANQLTSQGGQLFQAGMPGLQQSMGYYSKLLGGNRAALRGAVAPEAGGMADAYAGADSRIARTARGGERDALLAESGRERAGQYARLLFGAKAGAAQPLAATAGSAVDAGMAGQRTAGGMYGQLLGNANENRTQAFNFGQQTEQGVGGLAADLIKSYKANKGQ